MGNKKSSSDPSPTKAAGKAGKRSGGMPKNTANKITLARVAAVPVFMLLAANDMVVPAVAVFILASLSDLADGYIARKYNQITVFGKFMDPLADKMLVVAAMCYLIHIGMMPWWSVAVVLFREFAVSGMRLIAVEKNIVIAAGWSGKIKTGTAMVAIAVMTVFPIHAHYIAGNLLILATTVYSGVEYFIKNRKVFAEER